MHPSPFRFFFFILLAFPLTSPVRAQSEVVQSVQFITTELVGAISLDAKVLQSWTEKAQDIIKEHVAGEGTATDVAVLVTLFRKDKASIQIGSRPALPEKVREGMMKALQESSPPHTRYASFSFAAFTQINGGAADQEAAFEPKLLDPTTLHVKAFEKLDLPAMDKAIKEWATEDIIPILAHYSSTVDPQFAGVKAMGKILTDKKFLDAEVESLTTLNPDYWRAVMEMSPGNQLIPYGKVAMHLAKGEYDRADKLMFLLNFFSDPETLTAKLHDELSDMNQAIRKAISAEIQAGIALHDKGKHKEAVRHYDNLLKTIPHSAWAQYERYFSSIAGSNDDESDQAAWVAAKPVIYGCDPLYPMDVRASTGQEGYLLFRRQEIASLFKAKDGFKKDIVNYADIALDLGAYGYGAQLYWLINLHFKEADYGKRDVLAYYFYCLDKLGNQETLDFFERKDEYPKQFAEIEKERQKLMEESLIYKSFEKGK